MHGVGVDLSDVQLAAADNRSAEPSAQLGLPRFFQFVGNCRLGRTAAFQIAALAALDLPRKGRSSDPWEALTGWRLILNTIRERRRVA